MRSLSAVVLGFGLLSLAASTTPNPSLTPVYTSQAEPFDPVYTSQAEPFDRVSYDLPPNVRNSFQVIDTVSNSSDEDQVDYWSLLSQAFKKRHLERIDALNQKRRSVGYFTSFELNEFHYRNGLRVILLRQYEVVADCLLKMIRGIPVKLSNPTLYRVHIDECLRFQEDMREVLSAVEAFQNPLTPGPWRRRYVFPDHLNTSFQTTGVLYSEVTGSILRDGRWVHSA